MSADKTFLWAKILKPHGFNGEVRLSILKASKKGSKPKQVFAEMDGMMLPYFIESIQIADKLAFVKFEGVDSESDAKKMSGTLLYLDANLQSKAPKEDIFLQLVDYQVKDINLGLLGTIVEITEMPQQFIANMIYKEKEILFPVNEQIVLGVDQKNKIIEVCLPEGLLEVYL